MNALFTLAGALIGNVGMMLLIEWLGLRKAGYVLLTVLVLALGAYLWHSL